MSGKVWVDKDDDGDEIICGKIECRVHKHSRILSVLDEAITEFTQVARGIGVELNRDTIKPVSLDEKPQPFSELVTKTYEFTGRRQW